MDVKLGSPMGFKQFMKIIILGEKKDFFIKSVIERKMLRSTKNQIPYAQRNKYQRIKQSTCLHDIIYPLAANNINLAIMCGE